MRSIIEDRRVSEKNVPLASEAYAPKVMPHILSTFDMTSIYVVIIFYITNVTSALSGGAATFTYWILGAVTFFIPCVICTAQLAAMLPYEGSLYNWTHRAIGGYWSFFVGFCAWFPGVLVMVSGADVIVSYIQGLHPDWLTEPWQQGLLLTGVLIFSAVIAVQRFRMVQHMVNVAVCFLFLAVSIIGVTAVVWLAKGHASVTSFNHVSDWFITTGDAKNPGNLAVFGLVTFAYVGMEVPLNMAGEIQGLHVIKRHLLLGTLLVLIGYYVTTFTLLVTQGANANGNTFAIVTSVNMVLGNGVGDIVAVCIMASFVIAVVVYNFAYARILFVASVDRRLPIGLGKLNKSRIPSNAVIFQTCVAVVFTILGFVVLPYIVRLDSPVNLSNEVYNVVEAAATLVWVVSTSFLLINVAIFFLRNKQTLRQKRILPIPLLWLCIAAGIIASIAGVIDTLFNSWIVTLINNTYWSFLVGGLTLTWLILAAIGSMFGSSQADWEKMNEV
jgi:amino acid transporter